MQYLLDHGADVNARNYIQLSPLLVAVDSGKVEIARLLVSKGADMLPRIQYGKTYWPPLQLAVRKQNLEMVKALLEAGVDPETGARELAEDDGLEEIAELIRQYQAKSKDKP